MKLTQKIEEELPPELLGFIRLVAKLAASQGEKIYLAGGLVRDLLLGETSFDIDLVVEGDALKLAERLTQNIAVKITTHHQFHTAKLELSGGFSVDLTTARKESYAHPGALPKIEGGSLADDLFRRDFTINAMAISLNIGSYGELIDLYGGRDDLKNKLIRTLHEKSFTDDATRIWRALRYGVRLGFSLEEKTLGWLKRDIDMLSTISGDRIRYELECILNEAFPEKILSLADELGVLARLHPTLKGNGWLTEKFQMAQGVTSPEKPPQGLYLALLVYRLTAQEIGQFISYLRPSRFITPILRDTAELKDKLHYLTEPNLSPSQIYRLLHGYSLTAIQAVSIASDSALVRERMKLYLSKLRFVRPSLSGEDLKKMGIAEGPRIKEILELLLDARLDGKITSRKEEEQVVREWM